MIKNYKKSLIEPLDEDELHILHTSYRIEKLISQIQGLLNDKAHGIYLLGGLRGIGKTSVLNLCLKEVRYGNYLRIKIDANRILNKSDFLYFIVDEICASLHGVLDEETIVKDLNELRQIVIEKRTKEFSKSVSFSHKQKGTVNEFVQERISFRHSILNSIFNRQSVIENEELISLTNDASTANDSRVAYVERTDDFLLIDKLSEFLKLLSNSQEYTVVISIDELDKQSSLTIETIFNYYKNLLLNSHIIVFMCVDTLKYASITAGNVIDNEYKSYFTECIYMPTLEFSELVKYLYREFLITDYEDAIIVNYLSCGVFRKINTHQYITRRSENIQIAALAFHKITENTKVSSFFDEYEYDIFKVLLKDLLELLLKYKKLSEKDIHNYLIHKENEYGLKFEFTSYFLELFSQIEQLEENFAVDQVALGDSFTRRYKVIDSKLPVKSFVDRKKIEFDHKFMGRNINTSIYTNDCTPVLIEQRNVDAFYYFQRFVETLDSKIENVIVIEKIGNWDEHEVQIFSGIVIVNKAVGRIAYIIEECSFSYEGRPTYRDVLDFLEKLSIKK